MRASVRVRVRVRVSETHPYGVDHSRRRHTSRNRGKCVHPRAILHPLFSTKSLSVAHASSVDGPRIKARPVKG